MSFTSKLLLLTAILVTGNTFAEDQEVKGTKKCLKVQNLTVCNNAAIGGDLTVAGIFTVAGNEAVTGDEVIAGDLTVEGDLSVAGIVNAQNDILYGLADFPGVGLSPIGSLETSFARMIWATLDPLFTANSGFAAFNGFGSGVYQLTFDKPFANPPVVIANPLSGTAAFAQVSAITTTGCSVRTFNAAGVGTDQSFNIIGIGV